MYPCAEQPRGAGWGEGGRASKSTWFMFWNAQRLATCLCTEEQSKSEQDMGAGQSHLTHPLPTAPGEEVKRGCRAAECGGVCVGGELKLMGYTTYDAGISQECCFESWLFFLI